MSSSPRQFAFCDSDLLTRYLDGEATQTDQARLESHLDQCERCRGAMETLAADGDFWAATTRALVSLPEVEKFADVISGLDMESLTAQGELTTLVSGILSHEARAETELSQLQVLQRWLDPSSASNSLGKLGKYEVSEIVGQGGMGLVLKGHDTELHRTVALKTMLHHVTAPVDARLRLAREARAAAALRHPHVVSIYGLETWRDVPVIIMPLIEGGTLQQYATKQSLSIEEVLTTAIQIASALSALHAAGIVHRDLKPSNILLQNNLNHVLLSDFGLARFDGDTTITHTDVLAGTPFFMSPEQALGNPLDARSDLFSFGSVLYWLCTGNYPFRGSNNYETLSRLIHDEVAIERMVERRVPGYLQILILGLLKKDAASRWENAGQVTELLEGCLHHYRDSSIPLPRELRGSRWQLPSFLKQTLVAGIGVWLVGLIAYGLVSSVTESTQVSTTESATAQSNTFAQQDIATGRQANGVSATRTGPTTQDSNVDSSVIRGTGERYGPLDELDQRAMHSDLASNQKVHYWLRRLAYLPVHEIPPDSLPVVQSLATHPDHATRELAQVILNKNPFQEVITDVPPEVGSELDNPFQEVLPNE